MLHITGLPPENLSALAQFCADTLGSTDFALAAFVSTGEESSVYTCRTGDGKQYIVRHSYNTEAFAKDAFAAKTFSSSVLIPAILGVKHLPDKSVICLSVRAPGTIVTDQNLQDRTTPLYKSFCNTLVRIHTTDISSTKGFGPARTNGQGLAPGWAFRLKAPQLAAWQIGRQAQQRTAINQHTFTRILRVQRALGPDALRTRERRLCHGDLKGDNFLAQRGKITGVIDWARFGYGDPAFDLGVLHVKHPGAIDHEAHITAIAADPHKLANRVLYYAMGECMIALRFLADCGKTEKMQHIEQRLLAITNEAEAML